METRDSDPRTCPPTAMLPIGEGEDAQTWAMVAPVEIEMFGFARLVAVVEVWSATFSAN